MKLPTEFKIPQDKLNVLLAVVTWYGAMPVFDENVFCVGDSFHDDIHEFMMSHVPDHPCFEEDVWCEYLKVVDGVVCAALNQDPLPAGLTEENPYTYVPFVAE